MVSISLLPLRSEKLQWRAESRRLLIYHGWADQQVAARAPGPLVAQRQRQQSGIWLSRSRRAQSVLDRCRFPEPLEWSRASVPGRAKFTEYRRPETTAAEFDLGARESWI
jgi:hypothetical protein